MLRLIYFSPHRFLNYDEMGVTVVQHKECELSPLRVSDGSLSSAVRGSLVTIVTCLNPTVTHVPPLLVFPRSNMKTELRVALHQVP